MALVRDLMTTDVVTIEPGTLVVDAARKMIEEEKGPLPVVAGDKVVGVVTDRDLIAHVVATGRDLESTKVDDVASRNLVTIDPDEDIAEARRLMAQHQVDRVLVLRRGRLVGLISEADIRSDEGPLARPDSEPPRRVRKRRFSTGRSTVRSRRSASSRVLLGTGLALQALGAKKGLELWQAARQPVPPPPPPQRHFGVPGAVFAVLGVGGGAAYLVRSGRLEKVVGRLRGQREPESDAVQTAQPSAPVVQSADDETTAITTHATSPPPPTNVP